MDGVGAMSTEFSNRIRNMKYVRWLGSYFYAVLVNIFGQFITF